ncbi:CC181 protein, partial [Thryothorus ludovicianus]|nr:CC181 protein [Thryothorus ludovicianus]
TKMSDNEDKGDVGDATENVEYEDDFEKDTECLTDEEGKQNLKNRLIFYFFFKNPKEKEEDVEAQIPKDSDSFQKDSKEMEENLNQLSGADVNVKVKYSNEKHLESSTDIGQEHHESGPERESSIQESKLENEQVQGEGEDEEIKRYVLGKIEEANKELENQAPVGQNRERKLKFQDEMHLQAPPPENAEVGKTALVRRGDFSVALSQLQISDVTRVKPTLLPERAGSEKEMTDGKVLVEKDGKFELLSLCDIESQGNLPPISISFSDIETQYKSPKSAHFNSLPTASQMKEMPPLDSKHHSDSVLNGGRDLGKQKTQSANISARGSTYSLTPKQKELRRQIELRNERLRREEEEMKMIQEERRRRENDIVFRAWLQKKKEQIREEKRIRRAKKLEEMSLKEVIRDPEEAYRLWLKKKQQQYMKEKRLELLRRQTEEVDFIPRREDCDRAFRDWLRRKREEKQAAELAAKERDRQLRLEARRARRMRNIHCI